MSKDMASKKIYSEMTAELHARKIVLESERASLVKAAERISAIDEEIAVINTELEEYSEATKKLEPSK